MIATSGVVIGVAGSGFAGPAVLGGVPAVGAVLVVHPAWGGLPVSGRLLGAAAAVMALAGPGVVVSAVAADTRSMRRVLEAGVAALAGG